MIKAEFFRNEKGYIYGFSVKDHGESVVCAGVSALVLNCINCIDEFTGCDFDFSHNQDGGFINIEIPLIREGGSDHDADLIFNCLLHGLKGIREGAKNDITIFDKEV